MARCWGSIDLSSRFADFVAGDGALHIGFEPENVRISLMPVFLTDPAVDTLSPGAKTTGLQFSTHQDNNLSFG